jgi:hypothetical protein
MDRVDFFRLDEFSLEAGTVPSKGRVEAFLSAFG